jgi:hypothetical protein
VWEDGKIKTALDKEVMTRQYYHVSVVWSKAGGGESFFFRRALEKEKKEKEEELWKKRNVHLYRQQLELFKSHFSAPFLNICEGFTSPQSVPFIFTH